MRLRALVIITNADATLRRKTVGPESTEVNVGVSHLGMGDEEPCTEDWLGEDVKDSVGNDLLINRGDAGTVSNTPDATMMSVEIGKKAGQFNSHWVSSPEEESVSRDGSEELANVAALGESRGTAVDDQVPNNNQVGNASNCVPAPLLSVGCAVGSKETSDDHNQVSDNCHEHDTAVHASEEHEVEKKKRSSDSPVNVTSPVDLAVDIVVGSRDALLVVLSNLIVLP